MTVYEPGIPSRFPAPALDQLAWLFAPLSDSQVRCVLHFGGRLDADRLARAFRLSLDAEPVLGCRFVRRRGRCWWERRTDLDALPLCPTVVCPDPATAERALQRFLNAPLEVSAGPAVAACLLRGENDTLAVKLHHVAADGLGMLRFLMVLADTYRALASDPAYRPRPNLAERGHGRVWQRLGPLGLLGALAAFVPVVRAARWGPVASGADCAERRFVLQRLAPEQVRALRAWSRAHGVSVNDVLLAALYRAMFAVFGADGAGALRVGVPIDLRRYLPDAAALPVGNFSNSADVAVTFRPEAPFADTLQRVHRAMRAVKTTGRGLRLALLAELLAVPGMALARTGLEQVVRRMAPTGGGAPFCSNVGVLNEQLVDFGGPAVADAYGLGPVNYPPGLLITVSTFRDVLTLAIGYCATATDPQLIERLLERMAAELPGGA
jgi:NRPS condensation-like uncharacterized protein